MTAELSSGVVALPGVRLNVVSPKAPVLARVVASRLCTVGRKSAGFIRHVEFDCSGTPLAGVSVPGQSFGVIPTGRLPDGKPNKLRLYSLASPSRGEDGQGNVVSTTVKRVIDEHHDTHKLFLGVCSNYICDLQVGDQVRMTGPVGKRFVLPQNSGDFNYIFISTGTGIAPFRGMTLDLLADPGRLTGLVTLISGAPYRTDLCYDDLFTELATRHASFRYLTAISREKQDDGHGRLYVDARLRTHRDQLLPILSLDNTLIYLCGIAGMEGGVYRQLANLLPPAELEKYLRMSADRLEAVKAGDVEAIRSIERTDRMFVEVYD